MNKRTVTIEIETVRAGQPRRYADSEFEYILTTEGMSEFEAKLYCTQALRPKKYDYKEWCEHSKEEAGVYFSGYYTFAKIDNNKYRYYVKEPFCD